MFAGGGADINNDNGNKRIHYATIQSAIGAVLGANFQRLCKRYDSRETAQHFGYLGR